MKILLPLLLSLAVGHGRPALAQAYCALRDPARQIEELYPASDSYRSIVRTIDAATREDIGRRLPFTLHFNELGRHTLYSVHDGARPVGVVHARSEAGQWGLVEVAWALDLELRIVGFEFQRCRDAGKQAIEAQVFRSQLLGKGFGELRSLLDAKGEHLAPRTLIVDDKAADLAAVLVRNALKTIAATEAAWLDDVWRLRALGAGQQALAQVRQVAPLPLDLTPERWAAVDLELGTSGTGLSRAELRAWRLVDSEGVVLGLLLAGIWIQGPLRAEVVWVTDAAGRLTSVQSPAGWPDPELEATFRGSIGKRANDLAGCAGTIELATLEVLLQLQHVAESSQGR